MARMIEIFVHDPYACLSQQSGPDGVLIVFWGDRAKFCITK